MELYPVAKDSRTDPKWGGQKFGKAMDGKVELAEDYVPVALDSEAAAAARALAALEAGKSRNKALAAGLAGSDEVGTMNRLLDEIEAEVRGCAAVSPADHATLTGYKTALPTKHLDATKWYEGMKAKYGVLSYSALRAACTPVAEVG